MFQRGGNETIVNGQDSKRWSYFEIVSLVRDWGYEEFRLWRKVSGHDEGYFHFVNDKQDEEISTHCLANNVDDQIWVEHHVKDMVSKVFTPKVCHLIQG